MFEFQNFGLEKIQYPATRATAPKFAILIVWLRRSSPASVGAGLAAKGRGVAPAVRHQLSSVILVRGRGWGSERAHFALAGGACKRGRRSRAIAVTADGRV